jgi:hypothetical protein
MAFWLGDRPHCSLHRNAPVLKHRTSRWNHVHSRSVTRANTTSGLALAILRTGCRATSLCVVDESVQLINVENIGLAVGITFVSLL